MPASYTMPSPEIFDLVALGGGVASGMYELYFMPLGRSKQQRGYPGHFSSGVVMSLAFCRMVLRRACGHAATLEESHGGGYCNILLRIAFVFIWARVREGERGRGLAALDQVGTFHECAQLVQFTVVLSTFFKASLP